MICQSCKADNLDTSFYCSNCGTKLERSKERICAQCRIPVPEGRFFCSNCGNNVMVAADEATKVTEEPKKTSELKDTSETKEAKDSVSVKISKPPTPQPEPERSVYVNEKIRVTPASKKQCTGSLSVTNKSVSFTPRGRGSKHCEFNIMMEDIASASKAWGKAGVSSFIGGLIILAIAFIFLMIGYTEYEEILMGAGWAYACAGFVLCVSSSNFSDIVITTSDRREYRVQFNSKSKKDLRHVLRSIIMHKGKQK